MLQKAQVFLLPLINQITARVWTLWCWEFWTLPSVQESKALKHPLCYKSLPGTLRRRRGPRCNRGWLPATLPEHASEHSTISCLRFEISPAQQVAVPVPFQTPLCLKAEAFLLALFLEDSSWFLLTENQVLGSAPCGKPRQSSHSISVAQGGDRAASGRDSRYRHTQEAISKAGCVREVL